MAPKKKRKRRRCLSEPLRSAREPLTAEDFQRKTWRRIQTAKKNARKAVKRERSANERVSGLHDSTSRLRQVALKKKWKRRRCLSEPPAAREPLTAEDFPKPRQTPLRALYRV